MANVDSMYLGNFLRDVETITAAGGSTTTEYNRLVERWREFNQESTARADLIDALTGKASMKEVRALHAEALVQSVGAQARADVRNRTADAVFTPIYAEYKKVAAANYETFRAQFNKLAQDFTKLCTTVDPDADPVTLMEASDAQRRAWAAAAVEYTRLDAMLPVLSLAAKHAGIPVTTNDALFGLTVDAGKAHRRRAWEAWDNENNSRGGRWAALIKAGATLAAPALEDHKPYPRPEPLYWKQEVTNSGGIRQFEVDPADEEYERNHRTTAAA